MRAGDGKTLQASIFAAICNHWKLRDLMIFMKMAGPHDGIIRTSLVPPEVQCGGLKPEAK